MPRLEIIHHGGGRATLKHADWASESLLIEENLPQPLSQFGIVHIAALSTAGRQLQFLEYCRGQGVAKISVGTYAKLFAGERDVVRTLSESADIFFMNENEARLFFGSENNVSTQAGKLLFVTFGEVGAKVHAASWHRTIAGSDAKELDPTGAGDTFCGTVLACLLSGKSAVEAAMQGNERAARCIESIGPAALFTANTSGDIV